LISLLRLAFSAGLFSLSLLAVAKVPHGLLWKPAVVAIELGHFLALVAIVLALPGSSVDGRGQLATWLAIAAALLFITPTVRAVVFARQAELVVHRAFPEAASSRPLAFASLWKPTMVTTPTRQQEIPGATGDPLTAVLYGTHTASPRPLVVAIHGGSWNSGDPSQLPELYHWLAGRGFAVAAVSYRLTPEHRFPAAPDDIATVVTWLVEHAAELQIDPSQVIMYGRSAGGHLALQHAYRHPSQVAGVVAFYPVTDLTWSWNHPTNPTVLDSFPMLTDFIGGPLQGHEAQYADASPIEHVSANSPPTLLFHGTRDELVFAEQSQRLADKLTAAGVQNAFVEIPWATHGCEANPTGPSGQVATYAIERFLNTVTTPSPPL
jgi:acetyl esterase/lipase